VYEVLPHKNLSHRRHPVSTANISQISEWMTFEYITILFDLPSGYLKDALVVTDERHPRVTLKQYAKKINKESSLVVGDVQGAVKQYMDSSHKH
jgi:hypothetical protein